LKCCGYCGRYIGYEEGTDKIIFYGQVDHLISKSKSAEHVYKWENYIWACTSCNKKKLEKGYNSDKKEITILNPCDSNEMKFVDYKKGNYFINCKDDKLKNKLDAKLSVTEDSTLLNYEVYIKQRNTLETEIKTTTEALVTEKDKLGKGIPDSYNEKLNDFIDKIKNSDYKLLISDVFYKDYIERLEIIEPQINKQNLGLEL